MNLKNWFCTLSSHLLSKQIISLGSAAPLFQSRGVAGAVKWAHPGLSHHHEVPLASVVMLLFPLGLEYWFLGAASANFSFDFKDSPSLALCRSPS